MISFVLFVKNGGTWTMRFTKIKLYFNFSHAKTKYGFNNRIHAEKGVIR